uniref:hypothetical protein n=1 Tax=Streptomyces sp. EN16 TaxID=212773 RepID=UPI00114D3AC0
MATSSQTQLTAAIALTQLLTDHPGLTLLNWRVPRDGMYAGVLQGDLMMDVDAREVVAAWHEALGGTVCEHTHSFRDEERRAFHLESSATRSGERSTWSRGGVTSWWTCTCRAR